MNREQKRKENKKNKKIETSTNISSNNEIYRLLKICIVVIIIFAILYLVVGLFITKEIDLFKDKDNESTDTATSNAILANSVFDQKEEEYYVYFYDFNNENTNIATSIVNISSNYTVYKVDTSDILNKNFVVEENSNKSATNLDELKVIKDTIIKVSNDKIIEYYEGEQEITSKLS